MFSIDGFLSKVIYSQKWLGINSDHDLDRFSAHVFASITVCTLPYLWIGKIAMLITIALWTISSIAFKINNGYWDLYKSGQLKGDILRNLLTNLGSRLVIPFGVAIWAISSLIF